MTEPSFISFYLRSNTIRVFVSSIRSIGQPHYVQFLINTETMQLVMMPAESKGFQSFRVPKGIIEPSTKRQRMTIRSQQFCRLLAQRLAWDSNFSYRVPGTVFTAQRIARFDLSKAAVIRVRNDS